MTRPNYARRSRTAPGPTVRWTDVHPHLLTDTRADLRRAAQHTQAAPRTLLAASLLPGAAHATPMTAAPSAQAVFASLQGAPGIPTQQGTVDPRVLGLITQRLTDGIAQADLSHLPPAEAQKVRADIQRMNQYVQEQIRSGNVKAVPVDQLAALGMTGNTMQALSVGGLQGQSVLQAQGWLEDLVGVLLSMVPGMGPFFANALKEITAAIQDFQSLMSIINTLQDVGSIIQQLTSIEGIQDLMGILGPMGGEFLSNQLGGQLSLDPSLVPKYTGIPGLKDIAGYASKLREANWQSLLGSGIGNMTAQDPMKTFSGVSRYVSPSAASAAVNLTFNEIAKVQEENNLLGIHTRSTQAQAATEQLSKDAAQSAMKTKADQATHISNALSFDSEKSLMRELVVTQAQANTIAASSAASTAASLAALTKGMDANTQAIGELVHDNIQRRQEAAVAANMEADYNMAKAVEMANSNAVVTTLTPVLAGNTSIEGSTPLFLPQPYLNELPTEQQWKDGMRPR
jgi:hypothetical protein